jgi:hypothetical protein
MVHLTLPPGPLDPASWCSLPLIMDRSSEVFPVNSIGQRWQGRWDYMDLLLEPLLCFALLCWFWGDKWPLQTECSFQMTADRKLKFSQLQLNSANSLSELSSGLYPTWLSDLRSAPMTPPLMAALWDPKQKTLLTPLSLGNITFPQQVEDKKYV